MVSNGISFNAINKVFNYIAENFSEMSEEGANSLKEEKWKVKDRVNDFGTYLKCELLEILQKNKFSISLDSSTVNGV